MNDCKCHNHEEFLAALKAAPQDVSLPILEEKINEGYVEGVWNTSPSAVDSACLARGGERFQLADFVLGLVHAAPFYEKTHVGCHCTLTISGPGLPDLVIGAFGIV